MSNNNPGFGVSNLGVENGAKVPCKVYDCITKEVLTFDSREEASKHYGVTPLRIGQSIANSGKFKSDISGETKWYAARAINYGKGTVVCASSKPYRHAVSIKSNRGN